MTSESPATVTVRRATIEDDAGLHEIDRTAWTPESGFPSLAARERDRFFFDEAHQPDSFWVAQYADRLVGFAQLVPVTPIAEAAHVLLLQGLAVSPTARRMGVAGHMIERLLDEVRRRGGRKLMLYVFATNTAAIRLYERCGFVVEARLRDQFRIGDGYVDSITMARHLTDE